METELMKIPISKINLPVAAAAEVSKLALALRFFCEKIYEEFKTPAGSPPQSLLPWLKEYRRSLHDVFDMTTSAREDGSKQQSVKVFIDVYNTIQSELPESAQREVARVAAKKTKEIDLEEAEIVADTA
jgi:hypothetical protein